MKRPRIGDLRRRLTLEAAVRTDDGGGGATTTWVAVADLWARVSPAIDLTSATETVAAEAISGRVTHTVVIRYRAGLRPAMRFRIGPRILDILSIVDLDEGTRFLRCLCRERDL